MSQLRWNETDDKWQFTNDGSTYADILTEAQVEGFLVLQQVETVV